MNKDRTITQLPSAVFAFWRFFIWPTPEWRAPYTLPCDRNVSLVFLGTSK
jgi:hypothetical protein